MLRKLLFALAAVAALSGCTSPEPPTNAVVYHCVALDLSVLDKRAEVQCAPPQPDYRGDYPTDTGNRIMYFAVPLSDKEWASRFIYVANTGLTSGMTIQFTYASGDTSGTGFGCLAENCRTPWEFALLKQAYVPYGPTPSVPVPRSEEGAACLSACAAERDSCQADAAKPNGPRPSYCAQQYKKCVEGCPP